MFVFSVLFCGEVRTAHPFSVFPRPTNSHPGAPPLQLGTTPTSLNLHIMDGVDLTKAVLNKGKQMASVAASAANGNGGKKRRKGTDLKPIVTTDANPAADAYVL